MACWIREWALHSEWLSWSNKEALCQTAVYLWRWPFSQLEGHDEETHSDSETTARGWIVFRHQQTQKLTDGILSEAAEDFLFIFFKAIQTNQNLFNFCVQQKQNTPNIRYKVSLLHVFPNRGIKNHLVTTNYNGEWIISGPGTKFILFFLPFELHFYTNSELVLNRHHKWMRIRNLCLLVNRVMWLLGTDVLRWQPRVRNGLAKQKQNEYWIYGHLSGRFF